ncbi:hypothetical protein N431DRAFT_522536, partial [Stipitochalara longipes BDJ]
RHQAYHRRSLQNSARSPTLRGFEVVDESRNPHSALATRNSNEALATIATPLRTRTSLTQGSWILDHGFGFSTMPSPASSSIRCRKTLCLQARTIRSQPPHLVASFQNASTPPLGPPTRPLLLQLCSTDPRFFAFQDASREYVICLLKMGNLIGPFTHATIKIGAVGQVANLHTRDSIHSEMRVKSEPLGEREAQETLELVCSRCREPWHVGIAGFLVVGWLLISSFLTLIRALT